MLLCPRPLSQVSPEDQLALIRQPDAGDDNDLLMIDELLMNY